MNVQIRLPEPGTIHSERPASNRSELAALWREALSRPMHSPACGCAVPSSIRLDANHVELDILDYVEEKHDLRRYADWVKARQLRVESCHTGFPAWLEFLYAQHFMPEEIWECVLANISATLGSMASHAANRLVPAGSLEKGWLGGKA